MSSVPDRVHVAAAPAAASRGQAAEVAAAAPPAVAAKRRPMLAYLHAFRAVAILFIVLGHCVRLFDWAPVPRVELFLLDLLENGTVLFVFIAGYLFEYLSDRYEYRSYLTTKLRNVIVPYLIISVPALVHDVLLNDPVAIWPQLAGTSWPYQVGWFLLKGGAGLNFPMWFIPMIALYYLAAPLFMQFVRRPALYWLLPVLVVVSLLIHRPAHDRLDTLHQAAYYFSAYVAGMAISHFRDRIEPLLQRFWLPLAFLTSAIIVAQWRWSPFHGNYQAIAPFSMEHGLVDWIFLQKMIMCLALVGFMRRWYVQRIKLVDLVADLSFPVFFLHAYFIFGATLLFGSVPAGSILGFVALAGGVFSLSVATVVLLKGMLGSSSRWVLGA